MSRSQQKHNGISTSAPTFRMRINFSFVSLRTSSSIQSTSTRYLRLHKHCWAPSSPLKCLTKSPRKYSNQGLSTVHRSETDAVISDALFSVLALRRFSQVSVIAQNNIGRSPYDVAGHCGSFTITPERRCVLSWPTAATALHCPLIAA